MDIIDETGTFYIDNFEYRFNGCDPGIYTVDKIYNSEGYCDLLFVNGGPNYQYYRKDHLGNNREVWNANGNVTYQRTQYYPSGLPWAESTGASVQNKKYNGKEFVEAHGLDEYDSSARWYYPAIMRTTTIDPLAEKYYSISPYAWCGNNPVRMVDPDGMDVYMLYYTIGNEDEDADKMFEQAALTRKNEIESQEGFDSKTDIVVMVGVSDISSIAEMTDFLVDGLSEKYGKTAEVGVWSHAGNNGPMGSEKTNFEPLSKNSKQMSLKGWESINFNWKDGGANMSFYGCNTGKSTNKVGEYVGSFAKHISELDNMKGVNVWGQTTSAYPSTNPYYRVNTMYRSFGNFNDQTYMVGGNAKEGLKSMWFNPFANYPMANQMNIYKNGILLRTAFQNR